jgi:hypothetical protein
MDSTRWGGKACLLGLQMQTGCDCKQATDANRLQVQVGCNYKWVATTSGLQMQTGHRCKRIVIANGPQMQTGCNCNRVAIVMAAGWAGYAKTPFGGCANPHGGQANPPAKMTCQKVIVPMGGCRTPLPKWQLPKWQLPKCHTPNGGGTPPPRVRANSRLYSRALSIKNFF